MVKRLNLFFLDMFTLYKNYATIKLKIGSKGGVMGKI